jgi:hypothetical protein
MLIADTHRRFMQRSDAPKVRRPMPLIEKGIRLLNVEFLHLASRLL